MSENLEHLQTYHKELLKLYQTGVTKELSFRTPLENLFNALKPENYTIIQETKAKESGAKPDFDIYKRVDKKDELSYNALIGFIECKDIDKDLDIESKQIQRYLEISPNIILTNYRRFILLSFGKVLYDIVLFDENLSEHLFSSSNTQDFLSLVKAFFDDTSTQIKSKAELVKVLSSQSFYLAFALKNAYDDKNELSSFHEFFDKTLATFQAIEKVEFSELDFCDTLAQSIVYGLFVSFVENENLKLEKIPTTSFIDLLPKYFKTLNEFIYLSLPTFSLPQNVIYVLDNVKKTLALLDKASMAKLLNLELEKIAIYLYEDFLKEYDELRSTQKRKQGGVFYTPQAIVNMIVSALDELLQSKFDKKQGFLDEEVKVLDFATGTGSFLAAVFEKIIAKEKEAFKNDTIKNKFLKDIYGFELSFVAYIVARLKLGQILKKEGFSDFSDADFQIYLNNTLDLSQIANYTMSMPLINLDSEWQKARNVKHSTNLLVILGNPPYNVKSKNKGDEILKLLQSYKQGLNETNIQPLDDDYIKFIRFAQWKLLEQNTQNSLFDTQNKGLLGFITNNSFLDGRTHRKMRESLAKAFDEIYILNLHGDSKDDENVFDIRVGVCISLFIKYTESPSLGVGVNPYAKVFYYSTNDNGILKRDGENSKFALLNSIAENGLHSIKWQELQLNEPYFWFVPKNFANEEYENFWALAKDKALREQRAIFEVHNSGIQTKRDSLIYDTQKENLIKKCKIAFKGDFDENFKTKYDIHNSSSYTFADKLRTLEFDENSIYLAHYRPFDKRFMYYKIGFTARPSYEVMKQFLQGKILGLCFPKNRLSPNSHYGLVVDTLADVALGGAKTGSETYIAPLYIYKHDKEVGKIEPTPNFTAEFKEFKAKSKVLKDKTPEQILAFIYANLFNPTYRQKYLEYLKIGFPRVNFEVSEKEFEALATIGQRLIDLHLLKNIPNDENIDFEGKFERKEDFIIEALSPNERYSQNTLKLNKNIAIKGITQDIYTYTIGGYEVIKQWLKYRKNYQASRSELEHLVNVAIIIKETLKIQAELANLNSTQGKK